jgi:DUF1680 family protein
MMFARRMNALHGDARYADTIERALYNTVLAGVSLTGKEYFYVNPLEAEPSRVKVNPGLRHVKPVRQKWLDCSCCPTNIARTIMGLGSYIYAADREGMYVNLYVPGTANSNGRKLSVETDYPYGRDISIKAEGGRYVLRLRNPSAAPVISLKLNGTEQSFSTEKGYIVLEKDWQGDEITLRLSMQARHVYSSPRVQGNAGKTAVMRGPLVYCAEGKDNGENLSAFLLPKQELLSDSVARPGLPPETVSLFATAYRREDGSDGLYSDKAPVYKHSILHLIPYFLWANRGENEMRVYLQIEPNIPD